MSDKWVIDFDFPQGHLVAMTTAEQAQHDADVAAGIVTSTQQATAAANAVTMRQALLAQMQNALDLAALIDANTATPAQQRAAVSLCLKGMVRLIRLVLGALDQSA